MTFKIMCYNILNDGSDDEALGIYCAGNRRDLIANVFLKHKPDILCMQEDGNNQY